MRLFWFQDAFVPLSIKNAEAERLARELAREWGTTMTRAVIGAIEDALRRTRGRKVAPSIRDAVLDQQVSAERRTDVRSAWSSASSENRPDR